MHFSALFAAFLTTLAVASPLPAANPDAAPAIVEDFAAAPSANAILKTRDETRFNKDTDEMNDEFKNLVDFNHINPAQLTPGYHVQTATISSLTSEPDNLTALYAASDL
ncbi:uncharacterized protein K452DRAFT_298857 [Aplosporella prunicola CBS 121167]|uniref:Uncharacterized protein n=1 Tax=Aplosporella prunicola CBS 121167 TaxID=1176127 RepID=A0A6A6BDN6_9PEZI|nr:uncharacterized protein K452DRAFT_298857 [Aplosporella prunicola CBS 121167]KAF2141493.1 hypothetical protein K452DRAFT_298857 [Aplosporella prunicola CBS 121167]